MVQNTEEIKKKAFSGVIWKFMERFIAQGVSLIVAIVIARILDPSDYSVVSLVTIFFTFANVFISGGLNVSLMQKQDADSEDYSTVLHISVLISIAIYAILFFCAPFIASAYKQPSLTLIIRIMGISLPITAVKSVFCAYISANLQFRKFFFATFGGTIVSAVVGIWMALKGFGAWALVAQQMSNTFIDTVILICCTRIRIVFKISLSKLKVLFKYGWKVFVASLISTAYSECTPLIIGVKFTGADLSYYTKGKSFPSMLSTATTNTLSSVLFPVLAKFQDDKDRIRDYTRLYMRLASFIVFPLMLGLMAVAENFVRVILTDKWLPAVFYIRIFCIACMFDIVAVGNCETIKAIGRSGVYLVMEIIKKSAYLITLVLFIVFSGTPQILTYSALVCTAIQIAVNTIPNQKIIGYKYRHQLADLLPNLILSLLMVGVVFAVGLIPINRIAVFILQILAGMIFYFVAALITGNKSFKYIMNYLKSSNGKIARLIRGCFKRFLWGISFLFRVKSNKVVVCSFVGRGYCDNPKYIVDSILKKSANVEIVWMVSDESEAASLPEGVKWCKKGSVAEVYHMITAAVWIDNARKGYARKKKKQLYIQTWHGGGAQKKVEKDAVGSLSKSYIASAKRDSKNIDIFLSDGDLMSKIFRESYWYNGKIWQIGYPRYDILLSEDGTETLKEKIYAEYSIPLDARAVLYAPTFRKDLNVQCYNLDYDKLIEACERKFGGKFVVLVHWHPNLAPKMKDFVGKNDKVYDVTFYPDMQELIKVSSVMISDYSSVIFDFSLTGKAGFRYATDINEYMQDRDLYLDINDYPYPLSDSNENLVNNISEFNEEQYRSDLQSYFNRLGQVFNPNSSRDCAELIIDFIEHGLDKQFVFNKYKDGFVLEEENLAQK